MKVIKLCLYICLNFFLIACNGQVNSKYAYSEKETEQFLDNIVKNAKVTISDITEIKEQPTNEFIIFTRYPLSKEKLIEYNKNNRTIINKNNDISDFATYIFRGYELKNENNEKLKFVDNGRTIYLHEYALWKYNDVLNQKLGIEIELNKKFEKLKGYITIEFVMPGKIKRNVNIPVNISIYDKEAK